MQGGLVQSLSQDGILEEGMATHASVFAWRFPWTEESGRRSPWSAKSQTQPKWTTYTHKTYRRA